MYKYDKALCQSLKGKLRIMQNYTAGDVRARFSEVMGKAEFGSQRVVVTKNGRPSVGIVPISDLELLAEVERLIDVSVANEALVEADREGMVSLNEIKKDLKL